MSPQCTVGRMGGLMVIYNNLDNDKLWPGLSWEKLKLLLSNKYPEISLCSGGNDKSFCEEYWRRLRLDIVTTNILLFHVIPCTASTPSSRSKKSSSIIHL